MTSTIPLEDHPGVTVVAIRTRSAEDGTPRTVAVLAEDSGVPGLAIVPAVAEDGTFIDGYALTHVASGYALHSWGAEVYMLRRIATELAKTPIDFTADLESLQAQLREHSEALKAAWIAGRYPKPEPDDAGAPKGKGVAPYPRTEAQATADAIARHVTRNLQRMCQQTWDLVGKDDDHGREVYILHARALVADWALVAALRALQQFDPAAANGVAREIWSGWEDGSTTHELVYEWAQEYGLPPLSEKDDEQATSRDDEQSPAVTP